MDYLHAILLALLQGLTEFLPISSSGHLVLLPRLLGWEDQGLAFDVAVHVGTLSAVVWYFRSDVAQLASALFADVFRGVRSSHADLARAVVVATVPVVVAGLAAHAWLVDLLRDPVLIAATTLTFGLLLWWADRRGKRNTDETALTPKGALLIGCAQALSLVPGVSRSGVTITAGLALGLTRQAAARFSFLLSIPVILAAGALSALQLLRHPEQAAWGLVAVGAAVAGVTAYACICAFLALVERVGMLPFVVYRVVLAVVLFWVFF